MDSSSVIAYIGLGSNLKDREDQLRQAIGLLRHEKHITVEQCSSLYETEPVGYTEQPPFLNMVIRLSTSLSPEQLLAKCLVIEQLLGRVREQRWGPRTIDLDVLMYDECRIKTSALCIPHPRMLERLFVLIPLLEIMPEEAPVAESFRKALETLKGKEGVRLWRKVNWLIE